MRWVAQGILIVLMTSGCNSRTGPEPELQPVWDHLWAFVFGHDTEYAAGYTDAGFNTIRVGTPAGEVERLLEAPLAQVVIRNQSGDWNWCGWEFRENRLQRLDHGEACESLDINEGMSVVDVLVATESAALNWIYSRSPGSHNYWIRIVTTRNGRVSKIERSLYWD